MMRYVAGVSTLAVALALLSACGNGASGQAVSLPEVHLKVELYPDVTPSPGISRCCRVVVTNPTDQFVYGFPCHAMAFDAKGRVVYDGPMFGGAAGLSARPGRHEVGYIALLAPKPSKRIRRAQASCAAVRWEPRPPD